MDKKFDVFLGYHKSDAHRAAELENLLESHEIHVWFDDRHIRAGELIASAIEKGITQSHLVILIVSKGLWKAGWVRKEFKRIVKLAGGEPEGLIPVFYKNVNVPKFLADRQGVRFQGDGDDQKNLIKLVTGIHEFVRQRRESGQQNELFDRAKVNGSRIESTESIPEGKNNMTSDKPSSKESTTEKNRNNRRIAPFLIGFGVVLGCATFVVMPYLFPSIRQPDIGQLLFVYIPGCLTSIVTIVLGFMSFFSDNIFSIIKASSDYSVSRAEKLPERYELEKKRINSEIENANKRLALDEARTKAETENERLKIELEKSKLEFEKEKYKNEQERKNNDRYFTPE